jgi:hypothetical protein
MQAAQLFLKVNSSKLKYFLLILILLRREILCWRIGAVSGIIRKFV